MIESKTYERSMSIRAVECLFYFNALWLFAVGCYVGVFRGWENSYILFGDVIICGITGYLFRKLQSRILAVIVVIITALGCYMSLLLPVEELQKSADYVSWDITMHKWFNIVLLVTSINGAIAIFQKKNELREIKKRK